MGLALRCPLAGKVNEVLNDLIRKKTRRGVDKPVQCSKGPSARKFEFMLLCVLLQLAKSGTCPRTQAELPCAVI